MSVSNGVVSLTAPVGLYEIANLLDEVQDVGKCCTSDNVNKWSKYKPFQYPSPETPDATTRKNLYNWGLKIVTFQSTAALGLSAWAWSKPTTWFRLTDFLGYNHNALKPLPTLSNQTINTYGKSQFAISTAQEMVTQDGLTDYDLSLGNVKLVECYLGVVLINPDKTTERYYFVNTEKGIMRDVTVNPTGTALSYPTKERPTAVKYNAILFASPVSNINKQTSTSGTFWVLDQSLDVTVTFEYVDGVRIIVSLMARKLQGSANSNRPWVITGTVRFENNHEEPKTFTRLALSIEASNTPGSQISGENWDDTTIAAESAVTKRISGELSAPGSYTQLWGYATAWVDGVRHDSGYQMIMMQLTTDSELELN